MFNICNRDHGSQKKFDALTFILGLGQVENTGLAKYHEAGKLHICSESNTKRDEGFWPEACPLFLYVTILH